MIKKSERDRLYKKHLDNLYKGVSDLSDEEINLAFKELLLCIPNGSKLYKYRHFSNEQNHFENNFAALSEGYLWLAAPNTMNDKVDSTLMFDTQSEFHKIYKFLLKNKVK